MLWDFISNLFPKWLHYWELRPKHNAQAVGERAGELGSLALPSCGSWWPPFRVKVGGASKDAHEWKWRRPSRLLSRPFPAMGPSQLLATFRVRKRLCVSHSCIWPSGPSQFTFPGDLLVLGFSKAQGIPTQLQEPIWKVWSLTNNSSFTEGNFAKHIYFLSLEIFSTKCAGIST